jgi:hypothetical protein
VGTYFSQREIGQIRRDFAASLHDRVIHQHRVSTTGSYGEEVKSYEDVATVAVGLAFSPFKFRSREAGNEIGEQVGEIFVRCRLPWDYRGRIEKEDRLVLTHLFDNEIDPPVVYEVQGWEEMTVGGLIINLRRVEL